MAWHVHKKKLPDPHIPQSEHSGSFETAPVRSDMKASLRTFVILAQILVIMASGEGVRPKLVLV